MCKNEGKRGKVLRFAFDYKFKFCNFVKIEEPKKLELARLCGMV